MRDPADGDVSLADAYSPYLRIWPVGAGAYRRADARTRTGDPFITSEVLYQLSYVGKRPAKSAVFLNPEKCELFSAQPRRYWSCTAPAATSSRPESPLRRFGQAPKNSPAFRRRM